MGKVLLKIMIASIFMFLIVWVSFGFVANNWRVFTWNPEWRFLLLLFASGFSGILIAMPEED